MDLQLWSRLLGILRHIRIPSSRLKVGERLPLELELWSRLGCFGILRHMRMTSSGSTTLVSARLLWNPSVYQDSQLSSQGRRTTSFGSIYNFGLGCFGILWYIRIHSSRLKVGGRPPLDLQLWSRLGSFGHSHWNLKPAGLQD